MWRFSNHWDKRLLLTPDQQSKGPFYYSLRANLSYFIDDHAEKGNGIGSVSFLLDSHNG
jgi:hypothetical protein